MRYVYMDNGATSFPKAPGVAESMSDYILNVGTNVNRGAYSSSFKAENIIYETRELLCELFCFNKPENVIFTKNITESMNVLIKGLLKEKDHVIVSSMEHNAVMRPLNSLNKVEYTKVLCSKTGELSIEDVENSIKPNTKAIIMTHASNVCGTILDLEKVGQLCRKHNLFFIIDSAQTAGSIDIDINKLNADAIGFTGHKSLLGPQGIGGFIVNDRINNEITTLIEGGTGSLSDREIQPDYMPDKFESGTLNIPGIYGLNASLKYLFNQGVNNIRDKEINLINKFFEGLFNIKNIELIGKKTSTDRTGIVSIDFIHNDNGLVAHELSKDFGIMTRSGLHCAPSAHKTLGTFPKGTVRFSLSHFTTLKEIDYAIDCINKIANK
ncbi:MAG TPA: aminotransferase class V-fold PLP-dependent enzyme [Sedimentibacter sp.]|jgi:cysteine desulfurase family protein|nr:aminotransferase class V-fold PLP-dependent enzyme [Sedimentibacter sp.]NLA14862.1 aminotransferase class V-fold PLP-dependent enzyme [Tissierellia bacterium]HPB78854.1 aminotransferase class V-fold PLP-dependent enzyme [Sedimentibacter sp.]HQO71661.1 aminotransferase class V-fold PLP-dependent enzyme [Sedimentibacter sp.]HQO94549.1 aminotransferase class V-fold PLP-dependent enzyme [Sedimentibacter sp.]